MKQFERKKIRGRITLTVCEIDVAAIDAEMKLVAIAVICSFMILRTDARRKRIGKSVLAGLFASIS